jgi:two-component system, chemotaxis family, chemotaxis protein CheY
MPGSLRVLVVDDQESMRQLVMSSLRAIGVQRIATAGNGEEALAELRYGQTDLVLLDVEMPRLGGVDTLKAIRANPDMAKLPVIMMTGRTEASLVQEITALGVSGYLVKPVSAAALAARIQALNRVQV